MTEAKESSSRALTELRDLVRGIYPPVLAARGLGDAIRPAGRADHRRHRGTVRVVIAEDLSLLREGLVRLLSVHGFEIVAAVASAPELLHALVNERPDVGIVDVRLPPSHSDDGLRAALAARSQVPGLPVLVLSQYVEQLCARELLADQAGGLGYLLKDRVFNDEAFTMAIRSVAAGGTVLEPEVVQKLVMRNSRTEPVARLTRREREVLALMAEGKCSR